MSWAFGEVSSPASALASLDCSGVGIVETCTTSVSTSAIGTSSSVGVWADEVGTSLYHCRRSSEATNALPRSSILLNVDLRASNTCAFSNGWWRMSSSIAVPIRTAFSLSRRTLRWGSDVNIEKMPGMMLGRPAS